MAQRINPTVSNKITMLVREGATNIRRVLREYVRSALKDKCPNTTNISYFPTLEDIRNHVYMAKLGLDYSKFDQDNLKGGDPWQPVTKASMREQVLTTTEISPQASSVCTAQT